MPVFDFSGASDKKTGVQSECTYTTFQSNEKETSPEKPIMILDNSSRQWKHHSCGIFTNPIKRTSFEFKEDDGVFSADIISIDSRFVSLLKWLGENHINVRLSGENNIRNLSGWFLSRTQLSVRNDIPWSIQWYCS